MSGRRLILAGLLAFGGCKKDAPDDSGTPTGGTAGDCAQLVGESLSASLYSVWGTASDNVWTVGADDGNGPLVLHYDGTDWERVSTGTTGDLWWVWGDGPDSLWFSGEGGQVVHHTPSSGAFEVFDVAPGLVLFGLWGSSATDVYAVGSAVDGSGQGTIRHYDGTDWTEQTIPVEAVAGQVFKIWGSSATDIWAVGSSGQVLHSTGDGNWTAAPTVVSDTTTLFTVSGCGSEVVAVGGFGNAAVARTTDGTNWADDSPEPLQLAPGFNGVAVDCTHGTVAAGNNGAIWSRTDSWAPVCEFPVTIYDYHGVWIDPTGGTWAVGGNLTAQTDGVVTTIGVANPGQIAL